MKPLIAATIALPLLIGVVYGAAATEALTDRPLAVVGVLLIGIGLVRHHRQTQDLAIAPLRGRTRPRRG